MAITENRSFQNNSGLPQGPADPSAGRLDVRQTARMRCSLAVIVPTPARAETEEPLEGQGGHGVSDA
jgi:hypothetical protein